MVDLRGLSFQRYALRNDALTECCVCSFNLILKIKIAIYSIMCLIDCITDHFFSKGHYFVLVLVKIFATEAFEVL